MGKVLGAITFLMLVSSTLHAQSVVVRVDNVIYTESHPSLSGQKQQLAKLCNRYIQKNYTAGTLPYILLDMEVSKDTTSYQLAYDNVYGTSVTNDIYQPKTWDHTCLGIRIKVYDKKIEAQSVLKLLEYGIKNFETLKKDREEMMTLDFYDRADYLTVNTTTLQRVLRSRSSRQVEITLQEFNTLSSSTVSNE